MCSRITVSLGWIAYLWNGVNGLLGNHPELHPHLKQAVNTEASVTYHRVSSVVQLCWQYVGKTKMEKVWKSWIWEHIQVTLIIKAGKHSGDGCELVEILCTWWPSKVTNSPVSRIHSFHKWSRWWHLRTCDRNIRWHNILRRFFCGQSCGCRWIVAQKLENIYEVNL